MLSALAGCVRTLSPVLLPGRPPISPAAVTCLLEVPTQLLASSDSHSPAYSMPPDPHPRETQPSASSELRKPSLEARGALGSRDVENYQSGPLF